MEQKLSADYQKATTTDRAIVSTAQDVANILKQGGALKDQAAIYKFAKALDPEGAVREADYAAIVRTAGGLDYVQNLFNRALTGEQLSPKQRGEMSSLMNSMASVAKQRISKQQQTFGNNAKMYNLQPSNVFQASEDAPLPEAAQSQSAAMPSLPPAQAHKGRTIRDTATGKMLQSNGMSWVEVK